MELITILLVGFYTYLSLAAIKGWGIASRYIAASEPNTDEGLSILIPFRNEESNLALLIADLSQNTGNPPLLELIFIDDHSTDNGAQLILDWKTDIPFRLIQSSGLGKKRALQSGIEVAKFKNLLSLDADVRIGDQWLESVSSEAKMNVASMIILPVVPSSPKGFIARFANLDYFALFGATFASAAIGRPIMASGANLLFKKDAFTAQDQHIAGGDDMFLLHHVKQSMKKIGYVLSEGTAVHVDMPMSFGEFWSQRVRWTAKSSSYKDRDTLIVAWIVFLFNTFILIGFMLSFFLPHCWNTVIPMLGLKFLLDFSLLWKVLGRYERRRELFFFPVAFLIYPMYIFAVVLASRLGGFTWKDRAFDQ